MRGCLGWSRRAGWDYGESLGEWWWCWSLQGENNSGIHTEVCTGESRRVCLLRCVHVMCVCFFVPYTGGFGGDGAVYVSHGFQDVEGNKSDLVEAISALPPALG